MTNVGLNDAVQLAVEQAQVIAQRPVHLTGTIISLCAYGAGIHAVSIDGDVDGTAVPAHSVTNLLVGEGGRVALLFVRPHQLWIIGELNHTSSAARVWADVDTAFPGLGTNVAVNFTQVSYDLCADYDVGGDAFMVAQTGLYEVQHRIIAGSASTDDRFRSEVWELESNTCRSRGTDDEAGTAQSVTLQGSDTLLFDAGERIQLQAVQIAGGLRSIIGDVESQSWFCVRRL